MLLNPVPEPSYFPSFSFPPTSLAFCNSLILLFKVFTNSFNFLFSSCNLESSWPSSPLLPLEVVAFFKASLTADFIPSEERVAPEIESTFVL